MVLLFLGYSQFSPYILVTVNLVYVIFKLQPIWIVHLILGKNIILVLTFLGYNQFNPYILVAINLVHVIFKLQSTWFIPITY